MTREKRLIMGLPIMIAADDAAARDAAFRHFSAIDERFSTYKESSEISRINRGEISESDWSDEMREVFKAAEKTNEESFGYFDIRRPDGFLDPSGIVKGWAIKNAADLLIARGVTDFLVDAGGDVAVAGKDGDNVWSVGIRNPFNKSEIVKVVYPRDCGVATSGSYERGDHIYDPHSPGIPLTDIVSLTVIGPDVLEADRFATAAFAMGKDGIGFIESRRDLEGYGIDKNGIATMTSGFESYA